MKKSAVTVATELALKAVTGVCEAAPRHLQQVDEGASARAAAFAFGVSEASRVMAEAASPLIDWASESAESDEPIDVSAALVGMLAGLLYEIFQGVEPGESFEITREEISLTGAIAMAAVAAALVNDIENPEAAN